MPEKPRNRWCAQCGAPLPPETLICEACGWVLEPDEEIPVSPPAHIVTPFPVPEQQQLWNRYIDDLTTAPAPVSEVYPAPVEREHLRQLAIDRDVNHELGTHLFHPALMKSGKHHVFVVEEPAEPDAAEAPEEE
jgi:hypothetical protein